MSLSRARSLLPLFAAATIAASGWISARAGNDNPSTSQPPSQTQPTKAGKVGIFDDRKKSEKFVEAVPVYASKGRVAVMVYLPKELALYDKQLLLAVKEAAQEYATSTGRDTSMVLLPDNDADADTVEIHVWANCDPFKGVKYTMKGKTATTAMEPERYHALKADVLEKMNQSWDSVETTLLQQKQPGAPVVASTGPR